MFVKDVLSRVPRTRRARRAVCGSIMIHAASERSEERRNMSPPCGIMYCATNACNVCVQPTAGCA